MRQLLLLRHAKSSWDDPALSDHARPLNARGKRAAALLAATFRDLSLRPELVLVSSARRTLQTLEALGPLGGAPRIEATDDLYLATWTSLLDAVRRVPTEVRSLLLVAHNPGLHDLATALAGPAAATGSRRLAEAYPTGALAEFTVEEPWNRLEPGAARLARFLVPGDLAEPAA
ncbi:SixA phosphatase family protein [Roseomonas sp. BN140053]|uniref:SixA phosphatase family protein n=1 Tax=Roseomonas sp. BN140053 TaxID=3391898 RepID=UPI0039E81418